MADDLRRLIDPEYDSRMAAVEAKKALQRQRTDFNTKKQAAFKRMRTPEEMVLRAWDLTQQEMPDLPYEEQLEFAKDVAKKHIDKQKADRWSRREALGEAIEQGAGIRATTVEMRPEQAEALQAGRPYRRNRPQALARLAEDFDDDQERARVYANRLTEQERQKLQGYLEEDVFDAPRINNSVGWLADQFQRLSFVPGGLAAMMEKEREQAGNAPWDAKTETSGGLPAERINKPGIEDDWERLKAFGQGAWQTITDPRHAPTMERELKRRAEGVRRLAFSDAAKQLGLGANDPAVAELGQKLFEERLQNERSWFTKQMLEHPLATDIATSVLDPVGNLAARGIGVVGKRGLAPVGDALAEGARAARESLPVGAQVALGKAGQRVDDLAVAAGEALSKSKIGRAAQGVRHGFTYMPEAVDLEKDFAKAGMPHVGEGLRRGIMAADSEALESTRKFRDAFYAKLGELEQEIKASKLNREQLYELGLLDTDRAVLREIAPQYGRALDINDELSEMAWAFKEDAGLNRLWSSPQSGEWLNTQKSRANYMPKLKHAEPSTEWFRMRGGPTSLQSSTARARKSEDVLPTLVKDPVEQWKAWASQDISKGHSALSIKLFDNVVNRHMAAQKVTVKGLSATAAREEVETAIRGLRDRLGVKYVPLSFKGGEQAFGKAAGAGNASQGIGDIYQRLTGRATEGAGDALVPGIQRTDEIVVVPESYAKLLEAVTPFVEPAAGGDRLKQMLTDLNRAADVFMRPWRMTHTYLRSPQFFVRNAITAAGLSTIALGKKAFDPKLQGKAMYGAYLAAEGTPQALEKAAKVGVTLNSGQQVSLREILEQMERYGLLAQTGAKIGGGISAPGLADKVTKPLEAIGELRIPGLPEKWQRRVSRASLGYHAKATENFQHVAPFIGFLDDMTPAGIERAVDLTSKYAGNYNRLGRWERNVVSNMLGFYGWNRWMFPYWVNTLKEHPDRVRRWVQLQGGLERWLNPNTPFFASGQGIGQMGAPAAAQPQPGTHEYAVGVIDNPALLGMPMVDILRASFGDNVVPQDRINDYLSPLAQMALEMMSNRSIENDAQVAPVSFGSVPEFLASSSGRMVRSLYEPVSKPWQNMYQLFLAAGKPESALSMAARMQAGRDFMGLDHYIFPLFGLAGQSRGGMFDLAHGGIPGMWQYTQRPLSNAALRQRRALGNVNARAKLLQGAPAYFYRGAKDFYANPDSTDDNPADGGD